MEKMVKVRIDHPGQIPFISKRGPVKHPVTISEAIYKRLKALGYDVKLVKDAPVENAEEDSAVKDAEKTINKVEKEMSEETDEATGDEEEPSEETAEDEEPSDDTAEDEEPSDETVEDESEETYTREELEGKLKAELQEILDEGNVEYPADAKKADLVNLILGE
jgi:predicted metal-dependent hydrolase